MSIDDLKSRLRDIPGIEGLTMQTLVGRQVFGFNGLIAGVDMNATDEEIEDAIRKTADLGKFGRPVSTPIVNGATLDRIASTPLPPVNITEPKPMTATPPAPGSFAASIRAMMDEARAGVAKARADGLDKVKDAVGKLTDAQVSIAKVSANTAKMVEDEAASVLSELGQLSNDL